MSGGRERRAPRAEEHCEEPEIEQHGGRHRAVCEWAGRELQRKEGTRQAKADHPDIEAHADAPERLRIDTTDCVGAERNADEHARHDPPDRKSTRLNSSHANISYAVFCL